MNIQQLRRLTCPPLCLENSGPPAAGDCERKLLLTLALEKPADLDRDVQDLFETCKGDAIMMADNFSDCGSLVRLFTTMMNERHSRKQCSNNMLPGWTCSACASALVRKSALLREIFSRSRQASCWLRQSAVFPSSAVSLRNQGP